MLKLKAFFRKQVLSLNFSAESRRKRLKMNSMTTLLLGCISSLEAMLSDFVAEFDHFRECGQVGYQSKEKRNGVTDVKFNPGTSVSKHELSQWEQKNSCTLPEDLKAFYLTMDGFTLHWSTKISDGILPLGRMEINRLENLAKVQFSTNKEVASVLDELFDDEDESTEVPRFDTRSRIFELDHCDGCGKVCLVYMNTKLGVPATDSHIWFMDRAFGWHYMADNFTIYYRLMVAHLGFPQWQYSFTDLGISPQIQQWFNVYAPLRLEMMSDTYSRPAPLDSGDTTALASGSGTTISCTLDAQRVFKSKSDKKKQPANVSASTGQKKKPLTTSPAAAGKPVPNAQRSSASSFQSLSSKSRP